MKELMLIIAKAMPIEMILEELEEAISEYRIIQSKESRQKMGACAMMLSINIGTEETSIEDSMEALNKIEKGRALLTPNPQ